MLVPLYISTVQIKTPTMDNTPTTAYLPLESPSEIRLLKLNPGAVGSPIECTLIHTNLGESQYEALSYEWGTQLPDEPTIYISDTRKKPQLIELTTLNVPKAPRQIRHNLHSALCRLRLQYKERWLWVDALCINQTDNRERTHQVEMMGKIYQSAQKVISWLGEGNADDELAMRIFRSCVSTNGRRVKIMDNYDSQEVRSVHSWFSKSYWNRLWIVQEIILSQNLTLMVGGASISGNELDMVQKAMQHTVLNRSLAFNLLHDRPASTMAQYWGSGHSTLCDWIKRCRHSQFTDPRDRVYGFLGISRDVVELEAGQLEIKVDYEKDILTLFCEVARFYTAQRGIRITEDEKLTLGYVNGFSKHHEIFELGLSDLDSIKDKLEEAYEIGRKVYARKRGDT